MKITHLNRIWLAALALVLASVACMGGQVPQPVATPIPPIESGNTTNIQSTSSRANLIASTVQIYGLFNKNGKLVPGYVGSGTLISPDGLILTNAHVADPAAVGDPDFRPDALAVGLISTEDSPPVFSYRAEVQAIDGYLDLAVIRITATLDGSAVDPNSLNLPYVPLADSDQVHVGDHVNIYGFPAIGGETITYTDGNVSGFTSEDQIGNRAWIKTDATISGGNSGGLAANDAGQIIGVPTQASSGSGGDITDCRVVQDTNGDGVLNNQDNCIPIGGFINALRPVNLARPLINAAQAGIAYNSPYGVTIANASQGSGSEAFGPVSWLATDADCTTHDAVEAYPSDVYAVSAAFDFNGMTDGQVWGSIWSADGEIIYQSSETWSSGTDGNYSFCLYSSKNPMPNGTYNVKFYVDNEDRVLTEGNVVVGKGTQPPPTNTANGITLIGTITDAATGKPLANAYVFVLQSGVTYDFWESMNYRNDLILIQTKTDANGNYRMPSSIPRWMPYTVVVSIKGYYDKYGDNLIWYDTDPSEYRMDAEMNQ